MIIEIPDDNSIIKWKHKDTDNWTVSEISDLIKAYDERPKGEWILQYRCLDGEYYTCSQCERMILVEPEQSLSDYPFCHCGADMRDTTK